METKAVLDLAITGMTCGSCARHVTEAMRGVDGVEDVRVDLAGGRARVEYDPTMAAPARVIAAVDAAGYGAVISTGGGAKALPVRSGCGCGACA